MASERCEAELPGVRLPRRTPRETVHTTADESAEECRARSGAPRPSSGSHAEISATPQRVSFLLPSGRRAAEGRVCPRGASDSARAMDHYRDYGNDDSGDDANPSKQLDGWVCYACMRPAQRFQLLYTQGVPNRAICWRLAASKAIGTIACAAEWRSALHANPSVGVARAAGFAGHPLSRWRGVLSRSAVAWQVGAFDGLSPGVSATSSSDSLKGLLRGRRGGPRERERETDSERSARASRDSSSENLRDWGDYRAEPAGPPSSRAPSTRGVNLLWDCGTSSQITRVQFQVSVETKFGDCVLVVGSCPQLGWWQPDKSLHLTTDPSMYPTWTGSVEMSSSESFEYKYVIHRQGRKEGDDGECSAGGKIDLVRR